MSNHSRRLVTLAFFNILISIVLADRFQFGIREIYINTTSDWKEEDLVLGIGAVAPGRNVSNRAWDLGGNYTKESTIIRSDLVQEFDISANEPNFTVAFTIVNVHEDEASDTAFKMGETILGVAGLAAGFVFAPAGITLDVLAILVGGAAVLSDCTSTVVLGNATYTQATLATLELDSPSCVTETYVNPVPLRCSPISGISNYTATYCLEVVERTAANGTGAAGAAGAAGRSEVQLISCLLGLIVASLFVTIA